MNPAFQQAVMALLQAGRITPAHAQALMQQGGGAAPAGPGFQISRPAGGDMAGARREAGADLARGRISPGAQQVYPGGRVGPMNINPNAIPVDLTPQQ